jgi:hypothetical protein
VSLGSLQFPLSIHRSEHRSTQSGVVADGNSFRCWRTIIPSRKTIISSGPTVVTKTSAVVTRTTGRERRATTPFLSTPPRRYSSAWPTILQIRLRTGIFAVGRNAGSCLETNGRSEGYVHPFKVLVLSEPRATARQRIRCHRTAPFWQPRGEMQCQSRELSAFGEPF